MLADLLEQLNCTCSARLAAYKGTEQVSVFSILWPGGGRGTADSVTPDGVPSVDFEGARWSCSFTSNPAPGVPDLPFLQGVDLRVGFKVIEGTAGEISAGVEFDFQRWSSDHYVLMPAAVYNGNRFRSRRIPYPPLVTDPADLGPGVPVVISDVPRLNIDDGPSCIRLLTGDLTTPAAGIYDPTRRQGFWLLTEQGTRLGTSGIELEEGDDRSTAALRVTAPGMRGETRYTICDMQHPCEDRGADFAAGDEVWLRLRLYCFPCETVQGLFDAFIHIRKDLTGPVQLRHELPFSAAWKILEEKYNRQNWQSTYGYYSVGMQDNRYSHWQVGWVGGGMSSYPMLFAGDARSRERAKRTLDFMVNLGQAPSGLFRGIGAAVKGYLRWYGDGFDAPGTQRWHLIRKSADALYFLMKQLDLVQKESPGQDLPGHWVMGAQRCADAFVKLWQKYGQFGQFVDEVSGEMLVGNSSSAAIAPAGLGLAARMLDEPEYLRVAKESALDYYRRFVQQGYTTGGPGEILQNPDSESAAGMLESFVVLYEETLEAEWLERAVEMANQLATWVMSYDFDFPPESLFGRLGMRAAGSVWANVQNKHSAPGYCTLSGDTLFKLFRATGSPLYLDLIRETAHNLTQYLSRADRPVGQMPPGWMTERVNTSDWLEGVGEIFEGSCWCEVSCMLTYMEVPGLYIQPDTGFVCAIDHIEARVEKQENGQIEVSITNPTRFPAAVRTLVENSVAAREPLGQNGLWSCRLVEIEPGERVIMIYRIE